MIHQHFETLLLLLTFHFIQQFIVLCMQFLKNSIYIVKEKSLDFFSITYWPTHKPHCNFVA